MERKSLLLYLSVSGRCVPRPGTRGMRLTTSCSSKYKFSHCAGSALLLSAALTLSLLIQISAEESLFYSNRSCFFLYFYYQYLPSLSFTVFLKNILPHNDTILNIKTLLLPTITTVCQFWPLSSCTRANDTWLRGTLA